MIDSAAILKAMMDRSEKKYPNRIEQRLENDHRGLVSMLRHCLCPTIESITILSAAKSILKCNTSNDK